MLNLTSVALYFLTLFVFIEYINVKCGYITLTKSLLTILAQVKMSTSRNIEIPPWAVRARLKAFSFIIQSKDILPSFRGGTCWWSKSMPASKSVTNLVDIKIEKSKKKLSSIGKRKGREKMIQGKGKYN